ncbi:hypothetical protein E4U59_005504, partial [Claviceps monticola]
SFSITASRKRPTSASLESLAQEPIGTALRRLRHRPHRSEKVTIKYKSNRLADEGNRKSVTRCEFFPIAVAKNGTQFKDDGQHTTEKTSKFTVSIDADTYLGLALLTF